MQVPLSAVQRAILPNNNFEHMELCLCEPLKMQCRLFSGVHLTVHSDGSQRQTDHS